MPICERCGASFDRHSQHGPMPRRCNACTVDAKRTSTRESYARLRDVQAITPRRNAAQSSPPVDYPVCECGHAIVRRSAKGPWPKRCVACALLENRAKSLRWFYKHTDQKMGESRARYPGRLGRPQTAEHIRKRAESTAQSLANQRRACDQCGAEYTPTGGGQRFCPNHRRISSPGNRARPQHRRIYLQGGLYDTILADQEGGCGICGQLPNGNRLAIDHDHGTGEVRGLLCQQCNTGLGSFRDNLELLKRAIAYLGEKGVNQ